MTDKIRKQLQDISLGINDEAVTLPLELCDEAADKTQYSLIAKPVNPRKQNLRVMMTALPKLWRTGNEVMGRMIDNRNIQFLFQCEELMLSVLRHGPWSFNDWMCLIQKWSYTIFDEDLKRIPMWVQICGIPLQFLTLKMVTHIGESLGHFMETF